MARKPFVLAPITEVVSNRRGQKFWVPLIPGEAVKLEWWHFQANGRLAWRTWGQLLLDMGFTREGLLSNKDFPGPHGKFGLGYTERDLQTDARTGVVSSPAVSSKATPDTRKG